MHLTDFLFCYLASPGHSPDSFMHVQHRKGGLFSALQKKLTKTL